MRGVLDGFGLVVLLISLGFVLARLRVVGENDQVLLSRLVFYVAAPALLVSLLGRSDIGDVVGRTSAISVLSVVVVGGSYAAVAAVRWRLGGADTVIGMLCSGYVNGNLGLPVAIYVLGDSDAIVAVILVQLLLITPLSLAALDWMTGDRSVSVTALVRPLRNPITVATMVGITLGLAEWRPPAPVWPSIEVFAGMAVPGMLIAFGASIRHGPHPRRADASKLALATTLKVVVQPLTAWLLGAFVFGLEHTTLLAITVVLALPTHRTSRYTPRDTDVPPHSHATPHSPRRYSPCRSSSPLVPCLPDRPR